MRCHRTPKCLTLTHETAELINEIMSLVVFLGMKASTRINNNFWKASLAESLFSNPFAGVFNKTYWHRQIKANWGFVWMHRQASELCDVTGVLKTPNWHCEQLTPFFQDATQVLQFTGQESVSGSLFFSSSDPGRCNVLRPQASKALPPISQLEVAGWVADQMDSFGDIASSLESR